jgi:hypothetical protein
MRFRKDMIVRLKTARYGLSAGTKGMARAITRHGVYVSFYHINSGNKWWIRHMFIDPTDIEEVCDDTLQS